MNEEEERSNFTSLRKRIAQLGKMVDNKEISFGDALGDLKGNGYLPTITEEKIVYKDKPVEYVTSEARRNYLKAYRLDKKIEKEKHSIEVINQNKIKKALERKKMRCYKCEKVRDVTNPTSEISNSGNREGKILISWDCPVCSTKNRYYGGILIII